MGKKTESKASLTLAEPKKLINCIKAINGLVDEVLLRVKQDGLQIIAMDPANVAMAVFTFKKEGFVEYDVPKDLSAGVSLTSLSQILSRAKSDEDVLKLEFGDRINIGITGKVKKSFGLSIIEMDEKAEKVPELAPKATIKLQTKILQDAIDDADLVADNCSFICEKGKFSIKAEGDLSNARVEMLEADIVVAEDKAVKSKYSVEYLKKMLIGNIAKDVKVRYGEDYPLRLDYKKDNIELGFILAPRI